MNKPAFTSNTLLQSVRENDDQAWVTFVEIYSVLVYGWCRRYHINRYDSSDICQEVFVAAFLSIGRFERTKKGDLRRWLWTITRNKICDLLRSKLKKENARGGQFDQVLSQIPEELDDSEFSSKSKSSVTLVHRAIDVIKGDFQPKTFEAFWECCLNNTETGEVAELLNMTRNQVRQAKSRVLRRIRQAISEF